MNVCNEVKMAAHPGYALRVLSHPGSSLALLWHKRDLGVPSHIPLEGYEKKMMPQSTGEATLKCLKLGVIGALRA